MSGPSRQCAKGFHGVHGEHRATRNAACTMMSVPKCYWYQLKRVLHVELEPKFSLWLMGTSPDKLDVWYTHQTSCRSANICTIIVT